VYRALKGVVLRPLSRWDCGFESRQGHDSVSLVRGVYCQVQAVTGTDDLSRGISPSVVCLGAIKEPHRGDLGLIGLSSQKKQTAENKTLTESPLLSPFTHINP
jgi:hypothetical protein